MRKFKICLACIGLLVLANGCIKDNQGIQKENNIDKVLTEQTKEQEQQETTDSPKLETEPSQETEVKKADGIDFDLTVMNSDIVYATVYQMMVNPDDYEGKTVRMDGTFVPVQDDKTGKTYFYCVILDQMECCSLDMEFIWGDGSHAYPDEYPKENAKITVTGTYQTYQDAGDDSVYCRLKDAQLEVNKQ